MDTQSEQIVRNIQDSRDRLSQNISELEDRVRAATNWRTYYNRNPWTMLGVALGSGFLLSALFRPSK